MNKTWLVQILFLLLTGCTAKIYKLTIHEVEKPVDTSDKPIQLQERNTYNFPDITLDNEFEGARMSQVESINDTAFIIQIDPENTPINPSPFYAFRLSAQRPKSIVILLQYTESKHRYYPKYSYDKTTWKRLEQQSVVVSEDAKICTLYLKLPVGTTYLSGQELLTSKENEAWTQQLEVHEDVRLYEAGKSVGEKPIWAMDIHHNKPNDKPTLVILSRQHPPEVTGYMAMQHFVEEILADNVLANSFRARYRVLVYPMVNPDGVDEGHWRHNLNGIDLNRDWTHYRQKEVRTIVEDILEKTKKAKNKVVLGLDFHSTNRDVYYTNSTNTALKPFKDIWLHDIDMAFDAYQPEDSPSGMVSPTSKSWFYLQFQAEGITYEIGDTTDRKFIAEKARVAAREMMKLLVFR